ncbi:uncharacterized protein LOC123472343 [Daphnia magna]|uniref:uncharacterized protein LOC123472343 n=1 Tax=Daphnia magna TaxID=35525 RepID=UPI001E1BAA4E|nr:uncharacterized protein LOC123472343 [Daphnia magna]
MVNSCFICGKIPEDKENGVRSFKAGKKVLEWQEVISKNGLTQWSRLCTRHFDPGDIVKGKTIQNIFYPNQVWKLQIGAIPKHCLGITQPAPAVRKPLVAKNIASIIISNKENKPACRGKATQQKHAGLSPSSNTSTISATTSDVIFTGDLFDGMQDSMTQATSISGSTKNNSHLLDIRACQEINQQSASMVLPNPVVAVVTTSAVTCDGGLRDDWQHPTTEATSAICLPLHNSPKVNARDTSDYSDVQSDVTTSAVTCDGGLRDDWQRPTTEATSAICLPLHNSPKVNARDTSDYSDVQSDVTTSAVTCDGGLRDDWQHPTTEVTSAICLSLHNSSKVNARDTSDVQQFNIVASVDRNPIEPHFSRPSKLGSFCQADECKKKQAILEKMVHFERKRANRYLEQLKRSHRK